MLCLQVSCRLWQLNTHFLCSRSGLFLFSIASSNFPDWPLSSVRRVWMCAPWSRQHRLDHKLRDWSKIQLWITGSGPEPAVNPDNAQTAPPLFIGWEPWVFREFTSDLNLLFSKVLTVFFFFRTWNYFIFKMKLFKINKWIFFKTINIFYSPCLLFLNLFSNACVQNQCYTTVFAVWGREVVQFCFVSLCEKAVLSEDNWWSW